MQLTQGQQQLTPPVRTCLALVCTVSLPSVVMHLRGRYLSCVDCHFADLICFLVAGAGPAAAVPTLSPQNDISCGVPEGQVLALRFLPHLPADYLIQLLEKGERASALKPHMLTTKLQRLVPRHCRGAYSAYVCTSLRTWQSLALTWHHRQFDVSLLPPVLVSWSRRRDSQFRGTPHPQCGALSAVRSHVSAVCSAAGAGRAGSNGSERRWVVVCSNWDWLSGWAG